jgi:hypothetical protein
VHRSRVYAVIIGTPSAEADRAARFWSAALCAEARPLPEHPQFTSLRGAVPGLAAASDPELFAAQATTWR